VLNATPKLVTKEISKSIYIKRDENATKTVHYKNHPNTHKKTVMKEMRQKKRKKNKKAYILPYQ
jgi:hypothetical protein